jgi:hypothetical protein
MLEEYDLVLMPVSSQEAFPNDLILSSPIKSIGFSTLSASCA